MLRGVVHCAALDCCTPTWDGLEVGDHVCGLEAERAIVDGLAPTLQQQHGVKSLHKCKIGLSLPRRPAMIL